MKKTRIAAALGIIGMSAALVSGVFAQTMLNEEDQALYDAAMTSSQAFRSLSYDFGLDLNLAGITPAVTGAITGSGVIDIESGLTMETDGEVTADGQTIPTQLGLVVVGEEIYLRLGDESQQWQGGRAEDFFNQFAAGFVQGAGIDVDPAAVAQGDMSALEDAIASNPAVTNAVMSLAMLDASEFTTMSRVNTDGYAVFVTEIALGDLIGSEQFAPLIVALASAGGADTSAMTDAEMTQMSAMMGGMFQGATLTLSQAVNPETERVDGAELSLVVPLPAMMTGGSEDGELNILFTVSISGYDEAVEIVAPEDAIMAPSGS
jgi:hypothetical protein